MEMAILRSNVLWDGRQASERDVVRFHLIARQHNSKAIWVKTGGILITFDQAEASKRYPYEQWLAQARRGL